MSYKEDFERQANIYADLCEELYKKTELIGEKIILQELLQKYQIKAKHGFNSVNLNSVSEVCVEGKTINLISRTEEKYKAYVLYFEKNFNFPYLGFKFKKDIISPHYKDSIPSIIAKYNEDELIEITQRINEMIKLVEEDLTYLQTTSINEHAFFYKEYRGLFEGVNKFDSINDVLKDFDK